MLELAASANGFLSGPRLITKKLSVPSSWCPSQSARRFVAHVAVSAQGGSEENGAQRSAVGAGAINAHFSSFRTFEKYEAYDKKSTFNAHSMR